MSNLEAHHHPAIETIAQPLRNIFILPALWFFLHDGLFNFLFIGPCDAPPANILVILLEFLLIGASWRSLDALIKSILHAKRWWIHLLFDSFIFLFSLSLSLYYMQSKLTVFFFYQLISPLVIPSNSLSSIIMNWLLPTFSSPFYFFLVPFLGGKSEASC